MVSPLMTDPRLSQHPVDVMIRRIIAGLHTATSGDVDQIVERVATASFNPEIIPVPGSMRGLDDLMPRVCMRLPVSARRSAVVP